MGAPARPCGFQALHPECSLSPWACGDGDDRVRRGQKGGALTPGSNQYIPNPKCIGFDHFYFCELKKIVYSAKKKKRREKPGMG